MTPSLAFEIREAKDRREILLELYKELKYEVPSFDLVANISDSPEKIGEKVRSYLGIEFKTQRTWRDNRIAFNKFREILEEAGILVLQATTVGLSEMRGFSISNNEFPVIVVNRKDSYAGRSFSMFHELGHILLKTSGLCDMSESSKMSEIDQTIEIFCNKIASSCLVQTSDLINDECVKNHTSYKWSDEELLKLSRDFGVSKEVILRKLLDLKLTTKEFYKVKRNEYNEAYKKIKKKGGFVTPDVNALSSSGRLFVGMVLSAYSTNTITSSDVSDYLGVRLKHLNKIMEATLAYD